jgi:hypothetical protein
LPRKNDGTALAKWRLVRTSILFLLAGLVLPQQAAFRSEVALVRIDVEVLHNGQPVEELTRDDFEITDNGAAIESR